MVLPLTGDGIREMRTLIIFFFSGLAYNLLIPFVRSRFLFYNSANWHNYIEWVVSALPRVDKQTK